MENVRAGLFGVQNPELSLRRGHVKMFDEYKVTTDRGNK